MAFHAETRCPDPAPGRATSAVGADGLGTVRLSDADSNDVVRSLRSLLKACAWADGRDSDDLRVALRASALALELVETSVAGDPRMTHLTSEDVAMLRCLEGPGGFAMANALNSVAGRTRADSGPGHLAAIQACKSFPDLFSS